MWLPRNTPVETVPEKPLELLNRTVIDDGNTLLIEVKIFFTDHSSLFIQPEEDVTITNWSLEESYLTTSPPYYVYFSSGVDSSPVILTLELQVCS